MAKRKTTTRTRTVYRAAPKKKKTRRTTSGTKYIPSAAATVGLVVANAGNIKSDINYIKKFGVKRFMTKGQMQEKRYAKYIDAGQLVNDALYTAGGYVAGEIAKKYAPGVIKRPMGKIAKKIPKVI